jgi:hypothetical protein
MLFRFLPPDTSIFYRSRDPSHERSASRLPRATLSAERPSSLLDPALADGSMTASNEGGDSCDLFHVALPSGIATWPLASHPECFGVGCCLQGEFKQDED